MERHEQEIFSAIMALDLTALTTTPESKEAAGALRIVSTAELFGSDQEVVIDHCGVMYRLRITRQGKLILTK